MQVSPVRNREGRVREKRGPQLHHHLSLVHAGLGGWRFQTLTRSCNWPKAIEKARVPPSSTQVSAGTKPASPPLPPRVPRGAFAWVTKKMKGQGQRSADHHQPHQHTRGGRTRSWPMAAADMVSMARPMLADPVVRQQGSSKVVQPETINTCIGCNQACLDHTFSGKITSCLVNPRACHETDSEDRTHRRPPRSVSLWWAQVLLVWRLPPLPLLNVVTGCDPVRSGLMMWAASSTSPSRSPVKKSSTKPCATSATKSRPAGVKAQVQYPRVGG